MRYKNILKILSKMDCWIPYKEINIFGSFSGRIFYPLRNYYKVVILLAFNGINCYEIFNRIFIKLERCKDKENKSMRNFEYEKQTFL